MCDTPFVPQDVSVADTLRRTAADLFGDLRLLRLADLQFWHRSDARLLLVSLAVVAGLILIARLALPRGRGRHSVTVPALLTSIPRLVSANLTHLPLLSRWPALPSSPWRSPIPTCRWCAPRRLTPDAASAS